MRSVGPQSTRHTVGTPRITTPRKVEYSHYSSRDAEALSHVAVFLSELSLSVKPRQRLYVVKDEPDNRILECAIAGHADAIVTGDRAMLVLGEYRGVRIITLREYLGLCRNATTFSRRENLNRNFAKP